MSKLNKLAKNLDNSIQTVRSEGMYVTVPQNRDIEDDYRYSRDKYRELIDKGSTALDGMMDLAAESEHPRAYEVLSNMMKNVSDMTDKLMALQKQNEDLKNKKDDLPAGKLTQNNVFVGSSAELQRMLKGGDVIDVESE